MILLPEPSSQSLEAKQRPIDNFAIKYGLEGYLYDYRSQEYLRVKQLDFRSVYYSLSGEFEECKIPQDERIEYWRAIAADTSVWHAHNRGAQYNLPQGSWETYRDLSLPILGFA